jgi:hypothetical protein
MFSWAPIIGLIVTVLFCGAAWFLAPKGENQTYVHHISSSKHKSIPATTKPCLRKENPREQLLAVCKKRRAGDGRSVRFTTTTTISNDTGTHDHDSELPLSSTSTTRS